MYFYSIFSDNPSQSFNALTEFFLLTSIMIISLLLLSILIRKRHIPFKKNMIMILIFILLYSTIHIIEFTQLLISDSYLLLIFKGLCAIFSIVATIIAIKSTTKEYNYPSREEIRISLFNNMYDITDALPIGITVANTRGEIVYTNKYINRLFGYQENELIGQRVEVLLPEHYRKTHIDFRNLFFKNPTEKLMGSGRVLEGITKNGEIKYLEIALKPMDFAFKGDGNLIIAISDVTEDHNNKKIIDKKNQLINVATYGIPSLLSYLDKDGYYKFVNDAYTKYWGRLPEDIIEKHFSSLIPEESLSEVQEHIEKVKNGEEVNYRLKINFPSRGMRTLDVFYIPHFNNDKSEVLGIVALCHDSTELIEATNELEEKNKQLEEYAFLVSHDLRAPVRHISNFLELLKMELEKEKTLTEKETKYIKVILENSTKIQQMISGMLKIASINQVKTKMEFVEISIYLNHFIKEYYPEILYQINSETTYKVAADKDLLSLIFNNLIQNSIKFGKSERCKITIDISLEADKVVILFADNGIGIEKGSYTHIFAAFSKSAESEGLGLGLNIVQKALNKINGTIEIVPSDDGALFKIGLERKIK